MTLVINNDMVAQVLTMQDTIDVLEKAYQDLAAKEAVCRPRIDIQIPPRTARSTNGAPWRVARWAANSPFA